MERVGGMYVDLELRDQRFRATLERDQRLVDRATKDISRKRAEPSLGLRTKEFFRDLGIASAALTDMSRNKRTARLDLDIRGFMRNAIHVDRTLAGIRQRMRQRDEGDLFGNFIRTLTRVRVNLGIVSLSVRQLMIGLATLGPVIVATTGALTSLAGVLGTGLLGGLTVAGGALAGFGMALGGIIGIAKPLVSQLGEVQKAQEKVRKAQQQYGEGSRQAELAQRKLNNLLKGVPQDAQRAIGSIGQLGERWRRLTAESRPVFFRTVAEGVRTINALMPQFAARSNQAFAAVSAGMQQWLQGLRSQAGRGILDQLFYNFNRGIPAMMRGLGNLGAALGRIGAEGSRYFAPMMRSFADWATRVNLATQNTGRLQFSISRLVEHFRNLGSFLSATGRLLITVLNGGANAGNGLLISLTRTFNQWTRFLRTTEGQNKMAAFFRQSADIARQLGQTLGPIIVAIFRIAQALAPVTAAFLKGATAAARLVAAIVNLGPVKALLQGIAVAMGALFVMAKIKALGAAFLGLVRMLNLSKVATVAMKVAMAALNLVMRANPIGLVITALVLLGAGLVTAYKKSQTFRNIVNAGFNAVKDAGESVGRFFSQRLPRFFQVMANRSIGFINDLIGVLNKILPESLEIGKVGLIGGGPGRANPSAMPLHKRARGGFVDHPMVLVGEQAPTHPEYVIATNPAYRKRNAHLWMQAGHDLGIPGFQTGGIWGGVKKAGSAVGNAAKDAAGFVGGAAEDVWNWGPGRFLKALPRVPNFLAGFPFGGLLGKVRSGLARWAADRVKNMLGGDPGGPLPKGVKGSLAGAMGMARRMGLQITSTTGGKHAPNSWHYRGRAFDTSGPPAAMMRFANWARRRYGRRILELFYDPLGGRNVDNGRNRGPIGGHSNHVHLALQRGGIISKGTLAAASRSGMPGLQRGGKFPGGITREQRRIVAMIVAQGRRMGATPKMILAAIEAALVESGIRNVPYGDRDSLGVFQQRASWGSRASRLNPRQSAARFFREAKRRNRRGMSAGTLAQAVQRSAFPDRYGQQRGRAIAILRGFGMFGGRGGGGGSSITTAGGVTREPATFGARTNLENRIASAQARFGVAQRTQRTTLDDILALRGYTRTRPMTAAERRSAFNRAHRAQAKALELDRLSGTVMSGAVSDAAAQAKQRAQELATRAIQGTVRERVPGLIELSREQDRVLHRRQNRIDRALQGKLRPSTRDRLLQERSQIITQRAQGRQERSEWQRQVEDLQFERRFAGGQGRAGIEFWQTVAESTPQLSDDLKAVEALQHYWSERMKFAGGRRDQAGVTEAQSQLNQLATRATELRRAQITQPIELAQAQAQLTPALNDDLAANEAMLTAVRGFYRTALAAGNQVEAANFAGQLAQLQQNAVQLRDQIALMPLELAQAQAQLTFHLGDDLAAVNGLVRHWRGVYNAALAAGDQARATQAAQQLAQAQQNAQQLADQIRLRPLELAQAQAGLTTRLNDDLSVVNALLNVWTSIYQSALRVGDVERATQAAGQVAQLRDQGRELRERIATDPINARLALARLTETTDDDLAATRDLLGIYEPLLEAAKRAQDHAEIIRLAGIVQGLHQDVESFTGNMAQQMGAFNAARLDLYRTMGSNFSPVMGTGGTTVNVTNNYQTQPTDPHTWSKNLEYELQATV